MNLVRCLGVQSRATRLIDKKSWQYDTPDVKVIAYALSVELVVNLDCGLRASICSTEVGSGRSVSQTRGKMLTSMLCCQCPLSADFDPPRKELGSECLRGHLKRSITPSHSCMGHLQFLQCLLWTRLVVACCGKLQASLGCGRDQFLDTVWYGLA